MKVCSLCKINKEDSEFRLRRETRGKRGGGKLVYLNNTCKKCDSEISNNHYFKNKDNPEWLEKWRGKSSQYHKLHREDILKKMKERNATPEFKEYMKEWRKKNKDKVLQTGNVRNKKYGKRIRAKISPAYVKRLKATAEYQIKSSKSKLKNSCYINQPIPVIQIKIATKRIKKIIQQL